MSYNNSHPTDNQPRRPSNATGIGLLMIAALAALALIAFLVTYTPTQVTTTAPIENNVTTTAPVENAPAMPPAPPAATLDNATEQAPPAPASTPAAPAAPQDGTRGTAAPSPAAPAPAANP